MASGRGRSAVPSVNKCEDAVESPSTSGAESPSTPPRFAFRLRALGALMYHKEKRRKCAELDLVPDRVYTVGRSRSSCDIVFNDNRISRKHCQIYVDSSGTEIHLFEGARFRRGNGRVDASALAESRQSAMPSEKCGRTGNERMNHAEAGSQLQEKTEGEAASALKIWHRAQKSYDGDHLHSEESSMEESSKKGRAPLKLVYLDGKQLPRGGRRILNPGSEISLVACTKDGCPVVDLAFGEVSGFKVERRALPLERDRKVTSKVPSRSGAASSDAEFAITNTSKKRQNVEPLCTATCQFLKAQSCARGAGGGIYKSKTLLTESIITALTNGQKRGRRSSQGEVILRSTGAEPGAARLRQPESNSSLNPVNKISQITTTSTSSPYKGQDPGRTPRPEFAKSKSNQTQTPTLNGAIPEWQAVRASATFVSSEEIGPDAEKNRLTEKLSQEPIPLASEINAAEEDNSRRLLQRNEPEAEADAADSKLRWSGSGLLLNKLASLATPQASSEGCVSLEELLHPVDELIGIFAATLTNDVPWFLSSQKIPRNLPVTIVCHDRAVPAEESRITVPFQSWPHVTLIFPSFPVSSFIGCHHPKLFLLPRRTSLRVIITSANLLESQWLHVTNSVWWQDFPCKVFGGFEPLFSPSLNDGDFVHQLSTFVASLVRGVDSAAHWAVNLAFYDFSGASAVLVTSIPGLHRCPPPPISIEAGRPCALGVVRSVVVGVCHSFNPSVDPTGQLVRLLATILSVTQQDKKGLMTVQLRRMMNLQEDPNAIAVIVSDDMMSSGHRDSFQVKNRVIPWSSSASLHIGFLPKATAQWMSNLIDTGICTFSACVWPKQLLRTASTRSKETVELLIYAFKGPMFSRVSATHVTSSQKIALASLLHNTHRLHGLWRLNQVLSQFNWPDEAETDFFVGSSSVGTSLDASYFASFAAAVGKKVHSTNITPESDPDWATWTTKDESRDPSIGLVYPTIERVKAAKSELRHHRTILQFAETTWQRLQPAGILHDAVPFPPERNGVPMHTKVVQRRFIDSPAGIPYGWIYCGSHNFSAAAWGMPISKSFHACTHNTHTLGCSLHINNYEIGLLFIEPLVVDSSTKPEKDSRDPMHTSGRLGIDKHILPFKSPPPRYTDVDRPATRKALYDLGAQLRYEIFLVEAFATITGGSEENDDLEGCNSDLESSVEEIESSVSAESQPSPEDEDYGNTLWSQMESSLIAPANV